jgi:hypothetical protein
MGARFGIRRVSRRSATFGGGSAGDRSGGWAGLAAGGRTPSRPLRRLAVAFEREDHAPRASSPSTPPRSTPDASGHDRRGSRSSVPRRRTGRSHRAERCAEQCADRRTTGGARAGSHRRSSCHPAAQRRAHLTDALPGHRRVVFQQPVDHVLERIELRPGRLTSVLRRRRRTQRRAPVLRLSPGRLASCLIDTPRTTCSPPRSTHCSTPTNPFAASSARSLEKRGSGSTQTPPPHDAGIRIQPTEGDRFSPGADRCRPCRNESRLRSNLYVWKLDEIRAVTQDIASDGGISCLSPCPKTSSSILPRLRIRPCLC